MSRLYWSNLPPAKSPCRGTSAYVAVPAGWFITRTAGQRWWRRRHRSQQVTLDDPAASHGELAESRSFAMPDRVLQQHEVAGRVWAALDALPFDQRTVIVLREIDGLSYEEIAASLSVAVGTVKSRLARARQQLRQLLRPL